LKWWLKRRDDIKTISEMIYIKPEGQLDREGQKQRAGDVFEVPNISNIV